MIKVLNLQGDLHFIMILHLFNKHVKKIINKCLRLLIVENITDLLLFKICAKNMDSIVVHVIITILIQM